MYVDKKAYSHKAMINCRDYSYDYLRAFATLMIICCHIFQGFGVSAEFGYYLGGTYVDVFLLLSAYLLGITSKRSIESRPLLFLKKRTIRIIPTYYTYLTVTFLLIIFLIGWDSLSWRQIISHYLFLNWFWQSSRIAEPPLPQIGHLWFMSCIIFSYLSVTIWALIARGFPHSRIFNRGLSWCVYFVVLSIAATIVTTKIRFAVYPFTVVLGFILFFFQGQEIIVKFRSIKPSVIVLLLIIGNLSSIFFYLRDGYNYPSLIFWINIINSFLWIASAPIIFRRDHISRAALFISSISFEMFLVHHAFCLGAYSLAQYMPVWMASIFVFLIAILGGGVLSMLTKTIIRLFQRY